MYSVCVSFRFTDLDKSLLKSPKTGGYICMYVYAELHSFAYEEICGHLLLLLYMAKLAAETILSTHYPLICSHKLQNITFILVFLHPRLQHENFLTFTRKYNSLRLN